MPATVGAPPRQAIGSGRRTERAGLLQGGPPPLQLQVIQTAGSPPQTRSEIATRGWIV
jgi:hypothetical protein